jgi:hypothetical protein
MANLATSIIVVAGTMTFGNEWIQTKKIDWKVPVATVIAAAAFDGLSHLDDKMATLLSVIVLIGAATTQYNGYSPIATIGEMFGSSNTGTIKGAKGGTGIGQSGESEVGHGAGNGRVYT